MVQADCALVRIAIGEAPGKVLPRPGQYFLLHLPIVASTGYEVQFVG
jgi:hypothetical protein